MVFVFISFSDLCIHKNVCFSTVVPVSKQTMPLFLPTSQAYVSSNFSLKQKYPYNSQLFEGVISKPFAAQPQYPTLGVMNP